VTLFKQHAKTEWISLLVWSLLLGLFAFFTPMLWEQLRVSGALDQMQTLLRNMPGYVVGTPGADLMSVNGLLQLYNFGGWIMLAMLVYTGLFVVGMVTRDMDRRTMEFLLSLPVARWEIIVSRWVNLAVALLVLQGVQWLGLVAGVRAIGQEPVTWDYLLIELNGVLLYLAVGSFFLMLSTLIDDYGRGLGVTLGGMIGLLLFHMTTDKATGLVKALRDVLPFRLYDASKVLVHGQAPWGDMAILAAVAVGCLGLSVWLFQRKQISV
jgi:ABC-2 type transport system permease protein